MYLNSVSMNISAINKCLNHALKRKGDKVSVTIAQKENFD